MICLCWFSALSCSVIVRNIKLGIFLIPYCFEYCVHDFFRDWKYFLTQNKGFVLISGEYVALTGRTRMRWYNFTDQTTLVEKADILKRIICDLACCLTAHSGIIGASNSKHTLKFIRLSLLCSWKDLLLI